MNTETKRSQVSFASGCNIVLGAWMIFSPFMLGSTTSAVLWNSVIFGILVLLFAWIRLANKVRARPLSWWNAAFGVWLIIAPFALGFQVAGEVWNSVIAGLVILGLGAWSGSLGIAPRQVPSHH